MSPTCRPPVLRPAPELGATAYLWAPARGIRWPRRVLGLLLVAAAFAQTLPTGLRTAWPAWQEIGSARGLMGSYPTALAEDVQGRPWVATGGGELYAGDGFRFLKVDLPPELKPGWYAHGCLVAS